MAIHTLNQTEAEAPKSGSEIIAQRFDEYMGNCEGDPAKETQAILALEDRLREEELHLNKHRLLELTEGMQMNNSIMLDFYTLAALDAEVAETIRTRSQLNPDYEISMANAFDITSVKGLKEINGETIKTGDHRSAKTSIINELKKGIFYKKAKLQKSRR